MGLQGATHTVELLKSQGMNGNCSGSVNNTFSLPCKVANGDLVAVPLLPL